MRCVGPNCTPLSPMKPLMQWSDLLSRPRPKASERIAYGTDPNQFGDLWRPESKGLHPLVIMIHGGCWQAGIANLDIMDWAADDLRRRGYVVWNIEYRRIDQPGGGWPGTYDDVRTAIALTTAKGRGWRSDPERTVILGHSAGGQLALWAAKAGGAPGLKGVVALGAITDLVSDSETACGPDGLPAMRGPDPRYTSPYHMAPLGAPSVLITGQGDDTVPLAIARRYGEHARALGDQAEVVAPPGGHVEEVSPGSEAWTAAVRAVERFARP